MTILRNACVALSILRVKGPYIQCAYVYICVWSTSEPCICLSTCRRDAHTYGHLEYVTLPILVMVSLSTLHLVYVPS